MAITKEHNGKMLLQLYPAGIITDDFTNVKVVGTTTYEGAAAYFHHHECMQWSSQLYRKVR